MNGKIDNSLYREVDLDVRSVRGPLTREFLRARGIQVPEVYGDPALLISHFMSREELVGGHDPRKVTVVPNLNDYTAYDLNAPEIVLPSEPLMQVLGKIAASDLVVGSSLHAVIVAEALGIPARLITSGSEPRFKYEDYYLGSGRTGLTPAVTVAKAIEAGGEPPIQWDARPLIAAFPRDLFFRLDAERRRRAANCVPGL